MEEKKRNVFKELNGVDCSKYVRNIQTKRSGTLAYLPWAWAWGELKKRYPEAFYTIYEGKDGCLYHTDGRTCWVKTGVTVIDVEYIEYLPVMDAYNAPIPLEKVTSFDAYKSIQRSLTKAVARHGLGLYVYAGEDLPEEALDLMKEEALEKIAAAASRDDLQVVVGMLGRATGIKGVKDAANRRWKELE